MSKNASLPRHRSGVAALLLLSPLGLSTLVGCTDHDSTSGGPAGGSGTDPVDLELVRSFRSALVNSQAGPVPPPPAVSPELVELGRELFHEVEISGDRGVSCATCHSTTFGTTDGRTLPSGVGGLGDGPDRVGGEVIPRNSPALFNLHLQDKAFWDGRVELLIDGTLVTPAGDQLTGAMRSAFPEGLDVIAAQAMFPPTSRAEMRGALGHNELADVADSDFTGIWSALMDRLLSFPSYEDGFARAFPGTPLSELTFAHAAAAIAAFEVTEFYEPSSRFQDFLAGDDLALTNQELRGGIEFYGVAGCALCHDGPTFSDMRFHNIGMPQLGPGKGHGLDGHDDFGRGGMTGLLGDLYGFRTPGLTGISKTAPYGHAGQFRSLYRMVAHYRDPAESIYRYWIEDEVLDADLIGTMMPNQLEVLDALSPLASMPREFNVKDVTAFLGAL